MSSQVVLMQKRGADWYYLMNREHFIVPAIKGTLLEQFVNAVTYIRDEHDFYDQHIIVCSSMLVKDIVPSLSLAFPLVTFVPVIDSGVLNVFQKVMTSAFEDRQRNPSRAGSTLYVCSDASYGAAAGLAGWAWVANVAGVADYNFGVSEQSSIVHAELEGILHAIVDNGKQKFSTIHVYCDSQRSVEWAEAIINGKRLREHLFKTMNKRIQVLAMNAREVAQNKRVRLEWVRGHKSQRLNVGADFLSREARIAASRHGRLKADSAHVHAVLDIITR